MPTMIILDGSGSMLDEDAPGPRIDAAKEAIHSLVGRIPDDARIGLQVYGTSTGGTGAEKAAGCKDVKTLVPVGPIDRAQFLKAVDGVKASGYTPIGTALKKAAEELPVEGPKAIVLVSDGIDTCSPPPPCDVAEELAKDGIDLTVHTVGFRVDKEAREELECIAKVTEGTYTDAKDADQLSQAIQHKVEYAITGYDVRGTPVKGALTRDAADIPTLTPGQYVETFPPLEDHEGEIRRYYRIDPPQGWTPRVAVTGVMSPDAERGHGTATLIVQGSNADTRDCGRDFSFVMWNAETIDPIVASTRVSCEGETIIEVTRKDDLYDKNDMQVELVVRFQPPSDDSHVPPAEKGSVPPPPERSAEVLLIEGGSSFNSAAEITPGQTYSSSIVDGDFTYFKIPMTWGQQLTYKFEATTREGDRDTSFSAIVELYSPMRDYKIDARSFERWFGVGGQESFPVTGGTDEPVRSTSPNYPLDGYYYVVFEGWTLSSTGMRQNFEFTVDAVGEVEDGPIYFTDGVLPSESPSPSPSPTATPSPEPSLSVPASAETVDPGDGADAEEPGGIGAGMVALIVAVGVLLVGAGAFGGALFVRRSSQK